MSSHNETLIVIKTNELKEKEKPIKKGYLKI